MKTIRKTGFSEDFVFYHFSHILIYMPKIISHTPKQKNPLIASYDREHIRITLTCQSGLESLVRRECEKVGLTDMQGRDRLVSGTGTLRHVYELMVKSRFSNRVYIEILESKMTDFDTLHDTLESIHWSDYVTGRERIIIEASSTRSTLAHTPTIQSVAQKAIFSTIRTPNYTSSTEVHILILIIDDIAHVMLDVTGDPLHKRGYRLDAGDAPIKENLAAALIAFSGWKYKSPFLDPCSGSGTIAIEAAMLARGIAPGVERKFRIEGLPLHDPDTLTDVRHTARLAAYPSGPYTIYASDIDPAMIDIARANARRAGVEADIRFSVSDFLESSALPVNELTIITNPPY